MNITFVILYVLVAPDAIYSHVKTFKEEQRNMHYVAPEYGGKTPVGNFQHMSISYLSYL